MATRTTILLDDLTRQAAKELAATYGCSMSDAIRRAIIQQRDRTVGVSEDRRRGRTEALRKLFALAEGSDPAAEVARLKAEDEYA